MPKQTLLQKAKSHTRKYHGHYNFTQQEEELVIAWFNDEISITQLSAALEKNNTGAAYSFIALVAKQIFRNTEEAENTGE